MFGDIGPAEIVGRRPDPRRRLESEIWYADRHELTIPRLLGQNQHRIDHRHVVLSLVKTPGAFARYRYREDLSSVNDNDAPVGRCSCRHEEM